MISTAPFEAVSRLDRGHRTLADGDGTRSPRDLLGDPISAKTAHRTGARPRHRWCRPRRSRTSRIAPARHSGACAAGRERPRGPLPPTPQSDSRRHGRRAASSTAGRGALNLHNRPVSPQERLWTESRAEYERANTGRGDTGNRQGKPPEPPTDGPLADSRRVGGHRDRRHRSTNRRTGADYEASARSRRRGGFGRVAPVAPETSVETPGFGGSCARGVCWGVWSTAVVWQSGCVLAVRRIDTEEDCRREDTSRGRLRAVASVTPSMKIRWRRDLVRRVGCSERALSRLSPKRAVVSSSTHPSRRAIRLRPCSVTQTRCECLCSMRS